MPMRFVTPLLLSAALAAQATVDPVADAWQTFLREHGPNWTVHWHPATGTPRAIYGDGLPVSGPIGDARRASEVAALVLEQHAALLGRGESRFVPREVAKSLRVYILTYGQEYRGLPVIGGRADVRLNENGKVAMFGAVAVPVPSGLGTTPRWAPEQALATALRHVDITAMAAPLTGVPAPRLVVWAQVSRQTRTPVRLAYEVQVEQHEPRLVAGKVYVDAITGDVLEFVDGVYRCSAGHLHVAGRSLPADPRYRGRRGEPNTPEHDAPPVPINITGNVKAWLNAGMSPLDPLSNLDLANVQVAVSGGATGYTDANGNFNITHAGTAPVNVTVRLRGRYIGNVTPSQGTAVTLTQSVTPGTPASFQLLTAGAAQFSWSQPTTFYWTDRVYRWMDRLVSGGATGKARIATVTATVNRNATCNAYYTNNTINFYASGGTCNMTAYSTVIAHEWGHGLDDAFGGISQTDGLSEGWGDTIATYLTGQPIVGQNFDTTGGFIRTALNTASYPAGGGVHQQGQTWMGFNWDLRTNLIARLGSTAGIARAEAIVIPTIVADAVDQPAAVLEVFLLDDDDANLNNGTPNYGALQAAALRRNLPHPSFQFANIAHVPIGNTDQQWTPRMVTATITSSQGTIDGAELVFSSLNGTERRQMLPTGVPGEYRGLLAGAPSPQLVTYYIVARHSNGATARMPAVGGFSYIVADIHYEDSFDTGAVGWTHGAVAGQDDWQLGAPTGRSGTTSGAFWRDPTAAFSGNNCFGTDLGLAGGDGLYAPNSESFLRSPTIDLTGRTGLFLKYQRWLTVQDANGDLASIRVNGTQVWANPTAYYVLDGGWLSESIPIPQADNNPAVQLEWRLRSNATLEHGGWAVDDVIVYSVSSPRALTYRSGPEQVNNGGQVTAALFGPANMPAVLLVATGNGPINVPGLGQLEVSADFLQVIAGFDASGRLDVPLPIPADPLLRGVALYSQAVSYDGTRLIASNPMINLIQ